MDHFAGLDVSVKETSVCMVDDTGKIVREVKVASEPEALLAVLTNPAYHFKRIGLEAGPLSQAATMQRGNPGCLPASGRHWSSASILPKRRQLNGAFAAYLTRRRVPKAIRFMPELF